MKSLAKTPQHMPPQGIRTIMDMAWSMPDVLHVEVGEPDFPTPEHVLEAAQRALREGWTKYTPNAGIPSLREAVARKTARFNGVKVNPDQVVITPGAVAALASALTVLLDPGDEVLMPEPSWPNAGMWARVIGARPVFYPLRAENDFLPDLDELDTLVGPKTKAVVINTPSNPNGAVFPAQLMETLMEWARRRDLYVISDEIYEYITFDRKHTSAALFDTDGRVLTISGVSKGYAMTGWRVGWVVAARPIAEIITKLQEPMISCVTAVSQKAAEAALDCPQDVVETMRRAYQRRRDAVVGVLKDYGMYRYSPQGAFYIMIDISETGLASQEFAVQLLKSQKVAVAPGSAFGPSGEGWVRVSLATAEDLLIEAVRRLCRMVKG